MKDKLSPKDLRIGNYVQITKEAKEGHEHNTGEKIINQRHEIKSIEESVGVYVDIDCVELWNRYQFDYDEIKPIEITEQRLDDLWFSDKEYKTGYIGIDIKNENGIITDFVLTKPKAMGEWQENYAYELRENRFIELPYIHNLQNLFNALTNGKELEFKKAHSPKLMLSHYKQLLKEHENKGS